MKLRTMQKHGRAWDWSRRLGIAAAVASLTAGVLETITFFGRSVVNSTTATDNPIIRKYAPPPTEKKLPAHQSGPGRCGAFKYWKRDRCIDLRERDKGAIRHTQPP